MWSLFVLGSLVLSAPEAWVAPSHVEVLRLDEDAPRTRVVKLYAARGDREAFQLILRAGDDPLEALRVDAPAPHVSIPAPTVYTVGLRPVSEPSGRAVGSAPAWPDPLFLAVPSDLEAADTALWWVAYDVPRDAAPGVYWSEVSLASDSRGRLPEIEVRLEVFDVALPETPSLPSFLPVDVDGLAQACGIQGAGLEAWRAVYDPLAAYPLGFGWPLLRDPTPPPSAPPPPLTPATPKAEVTEGATREAPPVLVPAEEPATAPTAPPDGRGVLGHWAYLAAEAPAARFDWTPALGYSGGRRMQKVWLDTGLPRDVRALLDATKSAGLLPSSHVLLEPPGVQVSPAEVFLLAELVRQTGAGVARCFAGPPDPRLQRQVEQYAFPLTDFRPGLTDSLRTGQPLTSPKAHPASAVSASESGWRGDGPWVATQPGDAYDGCLASEWHTASAPTADAPAWIELRFPAAIEAKYLNLYWALGRQPREVTVETSFDGAIFTSATVRWEEHPPAPPFDGARWEGTFRYKNTFQALRLMFRHTALNRPVGLAEIDFGEEAPVAAARLEPTVEPWLLAGGLEYPALTVDAHPAEARLIPWLAWTYGFGGVYIPGVNTWPPGDVAVSGTDTAGFLLYPGDGTVVPSIRLERLRDGFEDYALLALYGGVFDRPPEALVGLRGLLERGLATAMDGQALDAAAENIVASRVAMGRALTERAESERE